MELDKGVYGRCAAQFFDKRVQNIYTKICGHKNLSTCDVYVTFVFSHKRVYYMYARLYEFPEAPNVCHILRPFHSTKCVGKVLEKEKVLPSQNYASLLYVGSKGGKVGFRVSSIIDRMKPS